MARRSFLDLARPAIKSTFEGHDTSVFSLHDLGRILAWHRDDWRLAQSTGRSAFVEYLLKKKILKKITLEFANGKRVVRYVLVNGFRESDLHMSLSRKAFYSHYTALSHHDLTEQIPKNVYVSKELTTTGDDDTEEITQEKIDEAFSKPIRRTSYVAKFKNKKITLLHSMDTGMLGVVKIDELDGSSYRVTDIERTLIDAVVRPEYCGGIHEVLKAYKLVKGVCSVNRIYSYLKRMAFKYPYNQAVGFCLERSGYTSPLINNIRNLGLNVDFYLTHNEKNLLYSDRWRLFYPRSIQ